MIHDWEEWNEPIQKLIKLMKDDYPNEFVLEITKNGAEIKFNSTLRCFMSEYINKSVLKMKDEDEAKRAFEKFQEGLKEGIGEYLKIEDGSIKYQSVPPEFRGPDCLFKENNHTKEKEP